MTSDDLWRRPLTSSGATFTDPAGRLRAASPVLASFRLQKIDLVNARAAAASRNQIITSSGSRRAGDRRDRGTRPVGTGEDRDRQQSRALRQKGRTRQQRVGIGSRGSGWAAEGRTRRQRVGLGSRRVGLGAECRARQQRVGLDGRLAGAR